MRFSHVNMGFFSQHGILKKSHVNMEHLFLMVVLTALTTIEGRLTTSLSSLDNLLQPLEASLATLPNRAERTNTAMRRRPRRPLSLQAFIALPAPQVRKQAQRQRSALPPLMMQQTASMHSWGSPAPTWSKTSTEAVSINQPFIVLTETKFSYRYIPVWARYSPHRTRVEAHANLLSP